MNRLKFTQHLPIMMVFVAVALTACQPKQHSGAVEKADIALIQAKVVAVDIAKKEFCQEDGCTQYDLQTVQTQQKWIDDYFLNRIKKAEPTAFSKVPDQKVKIPANQPSRSESSIYVRFVGQNYNLATFAIQSYSYSAGAAHGMSHQEFVIFDLATHKHITVNDLIRPNMNQKLRDELYATNQNWLENHNIKKDKLQLSDNFYYGVNGIVFVYPLYELASYAEGMSELTLPYYAAKPFIKAEYLPSLPQEPN